jgi:dTDP-4-amino-4,6-dideoxygalactose transaminase
MKRQALKHHAVHDLAVFGGPALFAEPKSTSNLLQPSLEGYLDYCRTFYDVRLEPGRHPLVPMLERRLAEFHQVDHCVTFCSGMWALVAAISDLALPGRDEVIMPSLTYRRLNDIGAWAHLKPHFCEVDPTSLALSVETVRPCINGNTALILAAHPIVNCCDSAGLAAMAAARGIPIVFDSVESVYESVAEGRIGGFGQAEAFSMHACKLINGFGGGYVVTRDAGLAERLRAFRDRGRDPLGAPAGAPGIDTRLNELHAGLALASLDDVDAQVERNRARYVAYVEGLRGLHGIRLLEFDTRHRAGFKNIVVELTEQWPLSRADTIRVLNAERILARPYYAPPLHRKAMSYPHVVADLPLTDRLAEAYMNLPCGHHVDVDDIERITDLLAFLRTHAEEIGTRLSRSQNP